MSENTIVLSASLYLTNLGTKDSTPVTGSVVFGREEGNCKFPHDGAMSKKHFRVWCEDGKYFLEDLGSSNHTFHNGVELEPKRSVALAVGDHIEAGSQRFTVARTPSSVSNPIEMPVGITSLPLRSVSPPSSQNVFAPAPMGGSPASRPLPRFQPAQASFSGGASFGECLFDFIRFREWGIFRSETTFVFVLIFIFLAPAVSVMKIENLPFPSSTLFLPTGLYALGVSLMFLFLRYCFIRMSSRPIGDSIAHKSKMFGLYAVVLIFSAVLNPISKKVLTNRVYQDCLVASTRDQTSCIRTVKIVKDFVTISESDGNHIGAYLSTPIQNAPGRVPSADQQSAPQHN